MTQLCAESYAYVLRVAGGQRSFGERAHHSQVGAAGGAER